MHQVGLASVHNLTSPACAAAALNPDKTAGSDHSQRANPDGFCIRMACHMQYKLHSDPTALGKSNLDGFCARCRNLYLLSVSNPRSY